MSDLGICERLLRSLVCEVFESPPKARKDFIGADFQRVRVAVEDVRQRRDLNEASESVKKEKCTEKNMENSDRSSGSPQYEHSIMPDLIYV